MYKPHFFVYITYKFWAKNCGCGLYTGPLLSEGVEVSLVSVVAEVPVVSVVAVVALVVKLEAIVQII